MNDKTSTPESQATPDGGAVATGKEAAASANGAAATPAAEGAPAMQAGNGAAAEQAGNGGPAEQAGNGAKPAAAAADAPPETATPAADSDTRADTRAGATSDTGAGAKDDAETEADSEAAAAAGPAVKIPRPSPAEPDADGPTTTLEVPSPNGTGAYPGDRDVTKPVARPAAAPPWPPGSGPAPAPGPVPGPGPEAAPPPPWQRVPGQAAAAASTPVRDLLGGDGPTTVLEAPTHPTEAGAPAEDGEAGGWTQVRVRNRPPRQAALQLRRIDPWSALKLALVLAVVIFFIWLVAVGVLYGVLGGMGVWERLNGTYADLVSGEAATGSPLISAGRVFGLAAVVGAINSLLFAVAVTVGAFVYNVSADLVGGIELTLSERD